MIDFCPEAVDIISNSVTVDRSCAEEVTAQHDQAHSKSHTLTYYNFSSRN